MARPGISYEDVKHIALALIAQGDNPTIQRVREHLGSGSNSTIAAHLKRWQQELATPKPALPPEIPEAVMAALSAFWGTALEQAEQTLAAERDAMRLRVQDAEQSLAAARADAERAGAERETLRADHEALAARLDKAAQEAIALDKQLAIECERRDTAERAASEALTRNAETSTLFSALRKQAETERDQLRAELAALREQAEARVQQERDRAETTARRQLDQIDAMRAEHQRELAALQQRERAADQHWREQERALQGELRALQQQSATVIGEHARMMERNQLLQEELQRLRGEQQVLNKQYFEALSALETLKAMGKAQELEHERLRQRSVAHEKDLKHSGST